MALLLNAFFGKPEDWRKLFAAEMPELDVRIWPDAGDPAEIDVAAVASLPPGRLKAGDLVELIGPSQTVDQAAGHAGTIGYEILTSLGHRFHRRHVNG